MLFQQAGDLSGAVVAGAIAGAAAGFLPHNFPAARIFMGDVGSVTLGFALAVLSMIAHTRGGVPWPALLLIHGAFLFDTVFTLIKRLLRGENVVRPHREHNYQLLIRGGKSHFAVTSTYGVISAGAALPDTFMRPTVRRSVGELLALPLLGLSTLAVWSASERTAPGILAGGNHGDCDAIRCLMSELDSMTPPEAQHPSSSGQQASTQGRPPTKPGSLRPASRGHRVLADAARSSMAAVGLVRSTLRSWAGRILIPRRPAI